MTECKTIGGQDPNKQCVFPFIAGGDESSHCLDTSGGTFCATSVNSNGWLISWGLCGPSCPDKTTNSKGKY